MERSYTLSLANKHVELFFIDTSPFVEDYQTAVWSVNEGRFMLPEQGCLTCRLLFTAIWVGVVLNSKLRKHLLRAGGILQQSWAANMKELEVRLARSKAKWKIVIGHHPIKSQLQVEIPLHLVQAM